MVMKKPVERKKSKQSTLSNFFRQPLKNQIPLKQPLVENPTLKGPLSNDLCTSASKENSIVTIPDLSPPNSGNVTAKPTVKSKSWWVTPPRGNAALPGRKRASDPLPSFDTSGISGNSAAIENSNFSAVKRASSNSKWQGRVKPIVRPTGMASSSKQRSQPSILNAMLSDEQKDVLNLIVEQQKSIFFTGAAGTGKSHILKQIVHTLRRNLYESQVAVTATTGLAAFNIGGKTLHRWAGIGTGSGSATILEKNIHKNREHVDNWRRCKVLVIDEVSMLDAELLDKLEEIARLIRKNDQPFGGIQLVLTGDFFQLPPVSKSGTSSQLCFEAKCWPKVLQNQIVLTKVFRQKDDRLIQMLNAMRLGNLDPSMCKRFESLARPVTYEDGLEPTELYPVRWQVDKANAQRLKALKGSIFAFDAQDSSSFDSSQKFFEQLMAPKRLELKIGSQVLLIRNLNEELVNGRRGQIVTFMNELEWRDLGPFFRDSQKALDIYNAKLNSAASDDTDVLQDEAVIAAEIGELKFPSEDLRAQFMAALRSPLRLKMPIVDFRQNNVVLIDRVEFSAEGSSKFNQLCREQLPLVPSWALSIHKSQGQTLDRVIVDLSQVFEAGQAYVAVSRATSCDRLQIKGFRREKVRVHPKVAEFYRSMEELSIAL